MQETYDTQVNINTTIGSIQFNIILDQGFEGEKSITTTKMHNHPLYEIHIIEAGTGVFLTSDSEISVSSGDFIIVGPKVYHSFRCDPKFNITKEYFKFNYSSISCMDDLFPQKEIIIIWNFLINN